MSNFNLSSLAINPLVYINKNLSPPGDIKVELELNRGVLTLGQLRQLDEIINPCILDAEKKELVFCNIWSISSVDIRGKRTIVYTAKENIELKRYKTYLEELEIKEERYI